MYRVGDKVRLVKLVGYDADCGYKVGDVLSVEYVEVLTGGIRDKERYFCADQIEPITEFKVGDKIRCYYSWGGSETGIIRHIGVLKKSDGRSSGDKNCFWSDWGRGWRGDFDTLTYFSSTTNKIELLKEEDTMSLKSRIEAITGESSLKEVDDIIAEMKTHHNIEISQDENNLGRYPYPAGHISIRPKRQVGEWKEFRYCETQYSKLTALKDALLWLYDKSAQKDNTELAQLKKDLNEVEDKEAKNRVVIAELKDKINRIERR